MNDDKTIFRVEKSKENQFVMIDRRPLEKDYLSWKAKGLLAYLLSRPDNWTVNFGDLVKRSTDGEYATRAAAKELESAGHLEVKRNVDNLGRVTSYEYVVHEYPLRGFPQVDNPQVGNPDVGNRDINDNEFNETKLNNTTDAAAVFSVYQNNIAMLTPIIADEIKDALDTYGKAWIIEAIQIAVKANRRNWRYILGILKKWQSDGKDSGLQKPVAVAPSPHIVYINGVAQLAAGD